MPKQVDPKFMISVRGIVLNEFGEVLLVKRNKKDRYNPGKWELPGGKYAGLKNLEEAVEIHVERETSLIVEAEPGTYYCHSRGYISEGTYKGRTFLEITLLTKSIAGKVEITKDHTEFIWCSPEEVFSYDLSLESKKAITQYLRDIAYPKEVANAHKVPILITAKALVSDERGRVLLLKRASNDAQPLKWEMPGGKIDKLETLNESLKREVLEETGLLIEIVKPSAHIQSKVANVRKYKGYTYVVIVSTAIVRGGKIRLSDEHEDYKWVYKKNIPELDLAENAKLPLVELLL
jgi:8-oxo-dGTP diphosphatase